MQIEVIGLVEDEREIKPWLYGFRRAFFKGQWQVTELKKKFKS